MKNKIKALFTDLDDTLLTNNKQITDRTVAVFSECRRQGILTGFATARAELPSKKYMDILKPDIAILDNGGLIKYHGETIYAKLMSADTVDSILIDVKQLVDLGDVTVETSDQFYSSCENIFATYGADYAHGIYCDYSKPLNKAAYKMTIQTGNGDAIFKIMSHYPECRCFGFAMEDWFCVCPKDISKGAAVKNVATYLNILPSEIAAFGDDVSDIEMLSYCDYGVAMVNALPEVKKAGNYQTTYDNNHDGVAAFIEEFFLKNEYSRI